MLNMMMLVAIIMICCFKKSLSESHITAVVFKKTLRESPITAVYTWRHYIVGLYSIGCNNTKM